MSLLLDALKQAEENKKSGLGNKDNLNQVEEPTIETEPSQATATFELEQQPEIQVEQVEKGVQGTEENETQSEQSIEVEKVDVQPEPEPEPIKPEPKHAATVSSSPSTPIDSSLNVFAAGGGRKASPYKKYVAICLALLFCGAIAVYWLMTSQSSAPVVQEDFVVAGDEDISDAPIVEKTIAVVQSKVNQMVNSETLQQSPSEVSMTGSVDPVVATEIQSTGISIKKSSKSASLTSSLQKGYNALQGGRYAEATTLYESILKKRPKQVDAMLGLAKIKANNGDLLAARRQYNKVLTIRPSNKIAQLGLLYTYKADSSSEGLTILQGLSEKYPNNPDILVAIGHRLAKQSKWSEAQQAYFKAYSAQPKNALFAYNLAVSLDRMEKYKAASSIYKKAIALNPVSAPVFNSQEIKNRLLEIGGN